MKEHNFLRQQIESRIAALFVDDEPAAARAARGSQNNRSLAELVCFSVISVCSMSILEHRREAVKIKLMKEQHNISRSIFQDSYFIAFYLVNRQFDC